MPNPLDALFPSNDRIAASDDALPPSPGGMIAVARRFNSLEAELLRGRLEADGIPATLGDSHTVQTDSLLTFALGGVRILVPSDYERQALRTIADVDGGAFALEEGAEIVGVPDADDASDGSTRSVFALARGVGLPMTLAGAVAVVVCVAVVLASMR